RHAQPGALHSFPTRRSSDLITANYTGNRDNQILNGDNRLQLSGRTTLRLANRLKLELTTEFQEQRFTNAPIPGPADFAPFERYEDRKSTRLNSSHVKISYAV